MKTTNKFLILSQLLISILIFGCDTQPLDPALLGSPQNELVDPSCASPTNLLSSNFVGTTINLSWTPAAQETSWQIEYGQIGFNQGSGTKRVATINSVSIPNLTSTVSYSFYIRSVCGNQSYGPWKGPVTVNPN